MIHIKAINSVLFALLLTGMLCAYQVSVTVTDVDFAAPSKLVGTNISIRTGNTVLYEKIADKAGSAQFELASGVYFIYLKRGYYPDSVMMTVISSNSNITAIMNKNQQTCTLYGQIFDSPEGKWDGQTTTVVDEKNNEAGAKKKIAKGGYFEIPYLYPGTEYQLRLDSGTDKYVSAPFMCEGVGPKYIDINVSAQNMIRSNPTLKAPQKAELQSLIMLSVMAGDKPVAGQEITATTPDGEVKIPTDDKGIARIFAAKAGSYIFSWNGQNVVTTVEGPIESQIEPEPVVIAPTKPEEPQKPIEQPAAPSPAKENEQKSLGLELWSLAMLAIGAGIIIAILAILGYLAARRKMETDSKKGIEHKHAEQEKAKPKTVTLQISKKSIEGQEQERHAHAEHKAHHKHAQKHKK